MNKKNKPRLPRLNHHLAIAQSRRLHEILALVAQEALYIFVKFYLLIIERFITSSIPERICQCANEFTRRFLCGI